MPRKVSSQPNDLELSILAVLWERGQCSARQIHDALSDQRETRLSSTTKMLQVMVDKELIARDDSQRPILFRPAEAAEDMQRGIVNDLVQRAFGGAAEKLILRAVESHELSAEKLAEIRRFISRMERKAK